MDDTNNIKNVSSTNNVNKPVKGGNTLWVIISIISLLCAGGILFFMLQERTKRIETEQKLSKTEKAKKTVEKKLDRTQLELIQLKDRAQLLANELAQEKKNYQVALQYADKKDVQIVELENNLTNEKKQRTSLANTVAQLRESRDDLEEKLEEARIKIENLAKSQLDKFTGSAGVGLKRIVVKPKKQLTGKVLVVNREFHFVVIDLGRKDAVGVGDEFVVYQGSQEIGKVQVEKIYDEMSTAAVLSGSQEEHIIEESIIKSF